MRVSESLEHLLSVTRKRMDTQFTPNQILGRLATIGCVAIEITQRCNLDCTLCYLSEHSQQVRDIPIAEVFRRLDATVSHFGKGTHVQITGGDPTLRKHTELVEIVRYANDIGLRPALFTNGIAASRSLLQKLAAAGLRDVAFHVDTTQRRTEYATERELNQLRLDYIERARGLGLMVIFNTTVHKGNFHEVPELLSFFRAHSDVLGLVSFQLQAETGRGEWRARDDIISQETVRKKIEQGVGKALPWGVVQVGHGDCHSYMPTIVSNGEVFPVISDKKLFADFQRDFQSCRWERHAPFWRIAQTFLWHIARRPQWWPRLLKYGFTQAKAMAKDVIKAKGQVNKLTIFVQNFMDARHLDQARINACSFMVMTSDGPVSMCEHNAARDDYILKPIESKNREGEVIRFEPLKAKGKPAQRIKIVETQ